MYKMLLMWFSLGVLVFTKRFVIVVVFLLCQRFSEVVLCFTISHEEFGDFLAHH